MPGTFESVLRADDLLYYQLELVNLVLGTSATGAPQLTRAAAGDAFIVVRLPAQNVAEQLGTGPFLPYQSGLAGPSRLTFKVPAATSAVDYRLDALLALIAGADLVTADALDGLASAIECPDRLLLVPQTSTRLNHRTGIVAFTNDFMFIGDDAPHPIAVTELWHTTLSDPANGASVRLRAIANPNDTADRPFTTALKKVDRDGIVAHSRQSADPNVIASSLVRLTSLGGTARLKSDWPPNASISLAEWEHQAELGRDQYVRTVQQGYLFPFGHRAAVTTITQRQPVSHGALQTAELVQPPDAKIVTVLEPERSYANLIAVYPGQGREMPFARVRIASATQSIVNDTDPITLQLLLTDIAGSHIDATATAFFVPAGDATDAGKLDLLNTTYQPQSRVTLNGQRIALAQNDDTGGDTSLNVEGMNFAAKLPRDLATATVPAFLPFMQTADARIPALEQIVGTTDPNPAAQRRATALSFHDSYLKNGFVPGDPKQVFIKFAAPIANIAIPAQRAGGLAAPKFPGMDGLSRLTGPVAGVEDFLHGVPLDPKALVGEAKLLGVIALKDVIATVTSAAADAFPPVDPRQVFDSVDNPATFLPRPVITTVTTASGIETRFVWKPKINPDLPAPLVNLNKTDASKGTQLVLRGRISATTASPTSPPALDVQGSLSNFALSLLGLVTVRFDSVDFKSQAGGKIDVKPHVAGVDFLGDLAFVQKLQELLPTTSMSVAPQVQTLPDGVTVRYAIPFPSVPLGVMTIENLALSSSVSLPFVEGKPAAVQFALSQRDNPFQISISIFGGTGFFSLQAQTDNGLAVEAALEFGGVAELDLIIVKGGVHLLVGVYLSMDSNGKLLIEGHLRFGGYVDVLGLVGVSIEFYLALSYDGHVLAGTGRLTVGVKLLFHTESFSFEVHREIPAFGSAPGSPAAPVHAAAHPPVATAMHAAFAADAHAAAPLQPAVRAPAMTLDQWTSYCSAFV